MLGSPVYGHLAGRLAEDPRPARAIIGDEATWISGCASSARCTTSS